MISKKAVHSTSPSLEPLTMPLHKASLHSHTVRDHYKTPYELSYTPIPPSTYTPTKASRPTPHGGTVSAYGTIFSVPDPCGDNMWHE